MTSARRLRLRNKLRRPRPFTLMYWVRRQGVEWEFEHHRLNLRLPPRHISLLTHAAGSA